ncbi:MAG TPA: MotA/TolQ/ExbB proton channel family protein [Burkholderiaceae bacterium]|nr:MotA/TolQ/ExbB proton channel family protein [Burkholderiaceae bacterium]
MFAIVQSLGWPIWPLIIASIVALALIIERSAALRERRILPPTLLQDVLALHAKRQVTPDVVSRLEHSSSLGRILAAGLRNERHPREVAVHAMESAGAFVAHELSRYLALLGSIGSVAPLLGLLGTVVGMIEIFASQQAGSNPQALAHGISIALYCTAFGIIVAVPAVLFYRHFRTRVESFLIDMEAQGQRLLDALYLERAARSH